MSDPGLWNPESGSFYGASLHRAIVARGWTVPEFSRAARMNRASVYNALRGRPVRDATAIRIFETLEKREPMRVAVYFLMPSQPRPSALSVGQ